MNWQNLNVQQFIENIGWMLIHSLWQISLIGVSLFLSLRILRNASANLRYLVSVAALFLVIVLPLTTFTYLRSISAAANKAVITKADESLENYSAKAIGKNNQNLNIPNAPAAENSNETNSEEKTGSFQNPTKSSFNKFLPYFVWSWFLGILFFSFRFCGGIWKTRRIKTQKISFINTDWQKKFDCLSEKTGIRRTVKFIQSEIIETPMVIGWLKPFVIVPSSVLTGINPRELETIIAHELIHIRRHDYLVNILQSFVEIILFFHPVTWRISAQIRRERENACDDEVLKTFNVEPLLYAKALTNLEDFRAGNLQASNIVAANGGNLMLRIQRIIKKETGKNASGASFLAIIPALLLVPAILAIVYSVNSQIDIADKSFENRTNTKKIAIGLYTASTVIPSENTPEDDEKTMRLVIAKLKQHKIPTTGFLKGVKVNVRAQNIPNDQERIVNLWRKANFEVGLLDLKYPQSFNSTIAEYQAAIKSRNVKMEPYYEKMLQFFKETQKSDIKKSSLEDLKKQMAIMKERREEVENVEKEWLKENDLTSVKYTFGTHDWIYAYTYEFARKENDRKTMNRIKAQYIDYMSKSLEHYENYARQIFERDIPQTIPLTPSHLLADSADELFAMIQKHGYQFVSMDEAMQDEAYQSSRSFANGTGSSWLESMALEKGKTLLNKPNVNLDVLKIWEENQPINRRIITK